VSDPGEGCGSTPAIANRHIYLRTRNALCSFAVDTRQPEINDEHASETMINPFAYFSPEDVGSVGSGLDGKCFGKRVLEAKYCQSRSLRQNSGLTLKSWTRQLP
jgi:hypothetical protein